MGSSAVSRAVNRGELILQENQILKESLEGALPKSEQAAQKDLKSLKQQRPLFPTKAAASPFSQVYKDIEVIIGDMVSFGLIRVIASFTPLMTYEVRER
jgi:hypothetical protein